MFASLRRVGGTYKPKIRPDEVEVVFAVDIEVLIVVGVGVLETHGGTEQTDSLGADGRVDRPNRRLPAVSVSSSEDELNVLEE